MQPNAEDTLSPSDISEITACDIRHWYPIFKKITIPTEFIDLSESFIEFVLDGNLFISNKSNCFSEWSDYSGDESWDEEQDEEVLENAIDSEQFEDIRERISKIVSKYEHVFPRLNWSSPSDAKFMSLNGSLKCGHANDIFLLLKSSNSLRSDLSLLKSIAESGSFDSESSTPTLALRKWHDFRSSYLFKCYVKNDRLIGISQLHSNDYYDFLVKEKDELKQKILDFFNDNIQQKFTLSSFIFDVYTHSNGKIYLIDIDPYDPETKDSILFSWEELEAKDPNEEPEIRVVESEIGIIPNLRTLYNSLPYDFQNLQGLMKNGNTDNVVEEMIEFMKQ